MNNFRNYAYNLNELIMQLLYQQLCDLGGLSLCL